MSNDSDLKILLRDKIRLKYGKEFQQLVWDILICHYPNITTPKMLHDFGSDGHDFDNSLFFAVYSPESGKYDNTMTVNKISNPNPKKSQEIGDYEKFSNNWLSKNKFSKWIFVTSDNLMGKPNIKIAELNSNGDGVTKLSWGLDKLLDLSLKLKQKDLKRIFNIPDEFIKPNNSNEVETIMDLIFYISENNESEIDPNRDIFPPDPDKKLERFSKYCNLIKDEIINSWMYINAKKEAENAVGLDHIITTQIVSFLKQKSVQFLIETENDPMKALNNFTDYLEEKLERTGKNFNRGAIRYYLIAEIPRCNVFPNEYE